jgi:DNA-binding CsgD family transcriptional regulator
VARGQLEALLEQLQTTKSIEELQVWTHELRDCLGVAHILYYTVNQKGEQTGTHTYSPEWAARYIEKDYKSIDPVIVGALRRNHPVDWKQLDWSSSQAREFRRDSIAMGVGNQGWSVPIWGPHSEFALFVVNDNADDAAWEAYTRAKARDFLLISHLVHQHAMRILNKEVPEPTPDLSPREKESLTLLSLGHSRAQVASELGISESTLRAYIDSARHKLGAHNTTHAVAQALARGVILP